jgi:hypothetical protein
MLIRIMIFALLLLPATVLCAAETYNVIGVAKPGDGSAVATAWAESKERVRKREETRVEYYKRAGGARMSVVAGLGLTGDIIKTFTHRRIENDRPDLIVQLGALPNDGKSSRPAALALKDGRKISVNFILESGEPGWIEIHRAPEISGPDPKGLAAYYAATLQKGGKPLSAEQTTKLYTMFFNGNTDLFDLVVALGENPNDRQTQAQLVACAEKYFSSGLWPNAREMADAVLVPDQRALIPTYDDTQMEAVTSDVSFSPDTLEVAAEFSSSLIVMNGKKQLSIRIKSQTVDTALSKTLALVNKEFKSNLTAQCGENVAAKVVNCTLLVENPDDAISKLAVAAGAKVETRDGKQVLVPAK